HDPDNERWVAMLRFHHLIDDVTSLAIISREVEACMLGQEHHLPASVPYRNYVAQARLGVSLEAHEAFFRELLGDIDEPTLPFDLHDVQGDGSELEEVRQQVDAELARRLRQQAKNLGVSVASLYHLAWAQVLGKVTGKDEVVFGTVLMGRMQGGDGADRSLGMFINTLPLRVELGNQGVRNGVKQTHARLTALLGHEHASLVLAQRCSGVQAPTPLFSALLNYRHSGSEALSPQADAVWTGIQMLGGQERTNYPLTLNVDDLGEDFALNAQTVVDIGAQRVCNYMQTALESLVEALEHAPQAPLHSLSILPEQERHQLIVEFNATALDYPVEQTLHGLLEAQVERTPQAVAVVHGDVRLSYCELNNRANQLAHQLIELGIGPDDRVAICVERGPGMIVALLAILKAGAGYVPLDPAYPVERLAYLLQDSTPVAVLVQTSTADALSLGSLPVINLDDTALQTQPVQNPHVQGLNASHLAYVIYTSGSTGLPKGVQVEHRNVARLFSATDAWFGFNATDVWALFHSFAFDFSVWEIWGALLHGGQLLIVPHLVSRSPQECYALLCDAGVTVLNQTPSAFRQLIAAQGESQQSHSLRQVIFGGEALDTAILKPWYARPVNAGTQLVNMYGITETTVHVTYYPLQAADAQNAGLSPIGRRIPDLQLYVLDTRRQPVPLGVAGELYVGGAGVARGYLNRPELNEQRFLANPFSEQPDARLYRTGDLVRWSVDGSLEYLERNDDQVKIRGFRIELGEIEDRLSRHPGVQQAVVMAREDIPGDKRLVAYFIADSEVSLNVLREYLLTQLPDYMVPTAYVQLEKLPLTSNGKLDRKALPAPDLSSVISREYQTPQGATERAIADIWQDLLGIDQVGRHDHFFELGGHSLLAVKLIERMRQIGLSTDVRILFGQPTLAALAAAVGNNSEIIAPANLIEPGCRKITPDMLPLVDLNQDAIDRIVARVPGGVANVQDIYALAPLQEGILYHHVMAPEDDPYRRTVLFNFDSQERVQQFAAALQAVIARHDILRTSVLWEDLDEPVQVVWRHAELSVEEIRLDPEATDLNAQLQKALDPRHHHLDIRKAPMMRIAYAHDPVNDRWTALLVFHHLINDATSLPVLAHEIEACMQGQEHQLPVSVPYRNYVAQARLGKSIEAHEAFFRDLLGDIDEPTLPFDLHDVQGDGSELEEVRQQVDAELACRLRQQAQSLGVSVASLYHLAWAQVLSKVTGKDEVVFGTVLMGRMQGGDGADRSLGMFINTLPLRVELGSQGVRNGVKQTHARLTALLGHEHASLVLAQRCSGVQAPTPLFSALLNYRHTDAPSSTAEGLGTWIDIERLKGTDRTNYPLALDVDDEGQGFALTLTCPVDIGAERIAGYVQKALESLVQALEHAPSSALNTLPILPQEELQKLLVDFNATAVPYPQDSTIHQLFEEQVRVQPDAIAVVFEAQRLSYAKLNREANRLAHHLIGLGIVPDDRVAICVERGPAMIVGLLAILKAGAGYVPLDPAYPAERLAYVLQDSAPAAVLVHTATADMLPLDSLPVINLDDAAVQTQYVQNPHVPGLNSSHLAYVIYTSGSTGLPKGVQVEHRNVANLVQWDSILCPATQHGALLHQTSISFDASVSEIFWPLCCGLPLVLARPDGQHDPAYLARLIREQHVSVVQFVPVLLQQFLYLPDSSQCLSLTDIVCGGGELTVALAEQVRQRLPWARLHNAYGPTETTVDCSAWTLEPHMPVPEATLPIGRPISNTRLYVLDTHDQPVPLGVIGQLHIGGAGVTRGYLNLPQQQAERFIDSPFVDGDRLYRSGDLVRQQADGNLEYLGRNDDQVKIRGFRIELGEIEARLSRHPTVQQAVVMAREDVPGDKRLVAYFTAEAEVSLDVLREHLLAQMPDYMVPAAYIRLEFLPLTPNGKLDRKALPAPDQSSVISREYQAPQGATEQAIAEIWQDLLGIDQVGRHDHFFELGGHSLLAVQMISRLQTELGKTIGLRGLFVEPTVTGFAQTLTPQSRTAPRSNLVPVRRDGNQRPLFLVHPAGGEVQYVRDLGPWLDADIPVYGLAANGFFAGEKTLSTIPDIAAHYLTAIREVQPHGPYRIAGWSAGGTIAHEMAHQAIAMGETIEFLGIIDSNIQETAPNHPISEAQFLLEQVKERMAPALEKSLQELAAIDEIQPMLELILSNNLLPELWKDIDTALLRTHLAVAYSICQAMETHVSPRTAVKVSLFIAEDESYPDTTLGWGAFHDDHLQVTLVPGEHHTMMREPHVSALGEAISLALKRK
ncbi:amino acid adenylation domain-containing protein, partial [Pseudomonas syringae]|uniref:amino acid adenylation domain-containing protein n=1 Tax=Pseudomonas syringae TaxID=317 RepID=UPI0032D95D98